MAGRKKRRPAVNPAPKAISKSMLQAVEEAPGREYEGLISHQFQQVNVVDELRACLKKISDIRKRPVVCYVANVVKPTKISTSIDTTDDLPFNEMIRSIPPGVTKIDIVLVTGGGTGEQVAKFVNALRPRFEEVGFILLNIAMSAGTIMAMSGDEIIMGSQSYIGPIDPQVYAKDGSLVPAQSILTLLEEIRARGEESMNQGQNPSWVDLEIINGIDPKLIGNAVNWSEYSIKMVTRYLYEYKFKTWKEHGSSGVKVEDSEKLARAVEIASLLCNHSEWKNHRYGISREEAWDVCRLKIRHAEELGDLATVMRQTWAILYWIFEHMYIAKIFLSEDYCIIRIDTSK